MNEKLKLSSIRDVLIRLEETIIFALIERVQFAHNAVVYEPRAMGNAVGDDNLVGYLLHETERIHARMRRYTSPDEVPFYDDLPEPVLPDLRYDENPLRPNVVNVNAQIRKVYEQEIIPFICIPGDDCQYGSTSVCDVNALQALSKRIHYGKFVAESKYLANPEFYDALTSRRDITAIAEAITDREVEARVLERVASKARTYGQELSGGPEALKINPDHVADVYRRWIIPMTKDVEVEYLMA